MILQLSTFTLNHKLCKLLRSYLGSYFNKYVVIYLLVIEFACHVTFNKSIGAISNVVLSCLLLHPTSRSFGPLAYNLPLVSCF